jgi:hypothetical protein
VLTASGSVQTNGKYKYAWTLENLLFLI